MADMRRLIQWGARELSCSSRMVVKSVVIQLSIPEAGHAINSLAVPRARRNISEHGQVAVGHLHPSNYNISLTKFCRYYYKQCMHYEMTPASSEQPHLYGPETTGNTPVVCCCRGKPRMPAPRNTIATPNLARVAAPTTSTPRHGPRCPRPPQATAACK